MFMVGRLPKVFAAPEERNVAEADRRLHISLLWSSCLRVSFVIYKHSAPVELKRSVAAWPRFPSSAFCAFQR